MIQVLLEIDAVEDALSTDTMNFQFSLETGTSASGAITLESDIGDIPYLVNEEFTWRHNNLWIKEKHLKLLQEQQHHQLLMIY